MEDVFKNPEDLDKRLLEELVRESLNSKTLSNKEEIYQYLKELKEEIEKDESTNR